MKKSTSKICLAFLVLAASCTSRREFTFVQISDTQIGFCEDTIPHYPVSTENLDKAVAAINEIAPDLVFNTGDLVNYPSDEEQVEIYRKGISGLSDKIRFQELIGNHDTRPELFDFDRFSFIHKKCAFVGINTNVIKDNDPRAEEQFEWLTGELKNAASKHCNHIFVFTHCPVFKESFDEPEEYFNFPMDLREKYTALFAEYGVDAVFSGHLHYSTEGELGGTKYITTGPVAKPLEDGFSGYRVVKVTKDGFEHEYLAL